MKSDRCHRCDEPYEVCPGGRDCVAEYPVDWRARALLAEGALAYAIRAFEHIKKNPLWRVEIVAEDALKKLGES